MPHERRGKPGAEGVRAGLPATTDHKHHTDPVGVGWFDDVERQFTAMPFAIHDASSPRVWGMEVDPARHHGCSHSQQQRDDHNRSHRKEAPQPTRR